MTNLTNQKSSSFDEFIFSVKNDPDALQLVKSFVIEVTEDANKVLDELRKIQSESIVKGVEAGFKIAKATLMAGGIEAASYLATAIGTQAQLGKISSIRKETNPELNAIEDREKKRLTAEKELKDPNWAENIKQKTQEEANRLEKNLKNSNLSEKLRKQQQKKLSGLNAELKDQNLSEKLEQRRKDKLDKLAKGKKSDISRRKEITQKMNSAISEAQLQGQYISAAGQAIAAIPKAQQDSLKIMAEVLKSITDQVAQVFNGAYDKVMLTLKSFIDIDYLAGLVSLGMIQLR